jgi:NSS family neurotransmitter:Na+ symporter
MPNTNKRAKFTGNLGFVLASASSAVGLGNVWRFPYLAAKYGGGIFLLVYIISAVTFGFTLMITEIALGRKTGLSVVKAYDSLNSKWKFLGYLSSVVPVLILGYYCVIGGWVVNYFIEFTKSSAAVTAAPEYFGKFTSGYMPLIFWAVFSAATAGVVYLGVKKGIELAGKVLLPALILLLIAVTVYTLTSIPNALEGAKFYILPNFHNFTVQTIFAAVSQMFYSMSLAMGIMVTYGSYMKKDQNIEKSVRHIGIFDTGVAFLAGLMIIPAVFVFTGGDISSIKPGPSLMFITLPQIFERMGAAGTYVGAAFFLLMIFAALTSSIAIFEAIVSIICDKFRLSRNKSILITMGLNALVGIPAAMKMSYLDMFDFASNSVIMPIVATLTCIFVGFVIKTNVITDEVKLSGKFKSERLYKTFVKYIAPVILIGIFIDSVFFS